MSEKEQVVHAPKSTSDREVEQLAYVESFDAVVDKDYAFVIYKETKTATGEWVIRVKGSVTSGATIDPSATAFKTALRKAVGHDEPYLGWGFNLQPRDNDPRLVETRVLIDGDGKPTAIEHHLITRKADRSARDEKVVTVSWPGQA